MSYLNEKKILEKIKVVNIGIDIDEALSEESENPVQNKVVKEALDNKQDNLIAGNGINIANGVISSTKKKDLLVEWTTKYNFAGGTIPIPRSDYLQYDFIIIEVVQYNSNGDGILAKTNIIHELQSPQTHQSSVTIYSERKARMVLLKAVFGANNIVLSGLDANPYNTTNANITSSDGYYTNNIWGVKL